MAFPCSTLSQPRVILMNNNSVSCFFVHHVKARKSRMPCLENPSTAGHFPLCPPLEGPDKQDWKERLICGESGSAKLTASSKPARVWIPTSSNLFSYGCYSVSKSNHVRLGSHPKDFPLYPNASTLKLSEGQVSIYELGWVCMEF